MSLTRLFNLSCLFMSHLKSQNKPQKPNTFGFPGALMVALSTYLCLCILSSSTVNKVSTRICNIFCLFCLSTMLACFDVVCCLLSSCHRWPLKLFFALPSLFFSFSFSSFVCLTPFLLDFRYYISRDLIFSFGVCFCLWILINIYLLS